MKFGTIHLQFSTNLSTPILFPFLRYPRLSVIIINYKQTEIPLRRSPSVGGNKKWNWKPCLFSFCHTVYVTDVQLLWGRRSRKSVNLLFLCRDSCPVDIQGRSFSVRVTVCELEPEILDYVPRCALHVREKTVTTLRGMSCLTLCGWNLGTCLVVSVCVLQW